MISLDVFDTCIQRRVYKPTDLFMLIEEVCKNNFKDKRIKAEREASKKNS